MKLIWMLRSLLYKFFFGSFGLMSYIGPPIFLSGIKNMFLGERVRVYPHSRIECIGGKIVIGNNVSIGQCLHLISGVEVEIGNDVTISANVFISDVEHQYEKISEHIMSQPLNKAKVAIGDNSFLGYGCVIRAGTVLGKQCVVGANSVVKGKFPDCCVIAGNPARIIKKYDQINKCWVRV